MPRKPWSTLRDPIMSDPNRRAELEEIRRASRIVIELGRLLDSQCISPKEAGTSESEPRAELTQIPADAGRFLAVLKDGIEQLGGRLEIAAVFPDRRVDLMT
jgi:hypothetical protein